MNDADLQKAADDLEEAQRQIGIIIEGLKRRSRRLLIAGVVLLGFLVPLAILGLVALGGACP